MRYFIRNIVFYIWVFFVKANNIYIELYFVAEDYVSSIIHNDIEITRSGVSPARYEGKPGQKTIIRVENNSGRTGISAIMYVGTTPFISSSANNSGSGWIKGSYDFLLKKHTIHDHDIQILGHWAGAIGKSHDFEFIIPNDRLYCSDKTSDGKIAYFTTFRNVPSIAPIQSVIVLGSNQSYKVKLINTPSRGFLHNNNIQINNGEMFTVGNLQYTGNSDGIDTIQFEVIYGSSVQVTGCGYQVRICYETCMTCNENNDTTEQEHNCIDCAIEYAPIIDHISNCLKKDELHIGYYYDSKDEQFKHCPPSCLTCELTPTDVICLACNNDKDYYFEENVDEVCNKIPDFFTTNPNYYLDKNEALLKRCYDDCATCHKAEEDDKHNCETCKTDFDFYEGKETKNCYDTNVYQDGYYKVSNMNYNKCQSLCKTCIQEGDEDNNNCLSCIEDYSFYENKTIDDCYDNRTTSHVGYYYDEENNKYLACHWRCQSCTKENLVDLLCLSCINDYYFIENTGFCIKKDTSENGYDINLYYLDEDNIYKRCYSNCAKCSKAGNNQIQNCDECINSMAFIETQIQQKNCVVKDDLKHPGYYYQTLNLTYMLCHSSCATCHQGGSILNHKCDSCPFGSTFNLLNTEDCMENCDKNWIINEFHVYSCENTCEGEYSYYVPIYQQCIPECPNNYPYHYKQICYSKCPPNTSLFLSYKGCLDDCFPDPDNRQFPIPFINHYLSECLDSIDINILSYLELSKYIQGYDFVFDVYDLNSPLPAVDNISIIDFSECEKRLRDYYPFLSLINNKIIIAKLDIFNPGSPTNQVEYLVYNNDGTKLNISMCSTENISLFLPIKNLKTQLNHGFQYYLTDIDYFDPHHPFYNDYCYLYNNPNADIPLYYRRDHIFPNISFCEITCYYSGIDYLTHRVNCLCSTKPYLDIRLNPKQPLSFLLEESVSNVVIAKCYFLFIQWSNLKTIKIIWLQSIILLLNIISIIVYYFKGIKCIFPQLNKNILKQTKPIYLITNKYLDYSIVQSKYHSNCHNSSQKELINNKRQSFDLLKSVKTIAKEGNLSKKDLLFLPFSFAIILDNRSFWRMYWDYLSEKITPIRIITHLSPFEIPSVQVSKMLLYISLAFSINALLLNDDLISFQLLNKSNQFTYILINSFLAIIIIKLIMTLIGILVNYEQTLDKLLNINKKKTKVIGRHFIFKISLKLTVFFILGMGLNCFGMYYSTLFSIIYRNNQSRVIIGGLYSIGFKLAIPLLMGLLVSIFRFTSIVNQMKMLYLISTYLHNEFL